MSAGEGDTFRITTARRQEAEMQTPALSLFDVLLDEYAQQAEPHDLPPLYSPGEIEKTRAAAEQQFKLIADDSERRQRINAAMVADFYTRLHKNGVHRAALCFSGGGIRSATFNLGVLQGLARAVDLSGFHYLSTVSGGGYIGSWFSAWVHRRGMRAVQEQLKGDRPKSPLRPEPETIFHLRSYSNYMSPRLGLLSADTWTLVAIFFRNLLLNWLVLIPLIVGALAVPRWAMAAALWERPQAWAVQATFWASLLLGIAAIAYIIASRPSLDDSAARPTDAETPRSFSRLSARYRTEGWFLIFCFVPLWLSSVLAAGFWAWIHTPSGQQAAELLKPAPNLILDLLPQSWEQWARTTSLKWLLPFALYGFVMHFGGFIVSRWWVRRWSWRDFVYSGVTGALGGAGLWLMAMKVQTFAQPVVGGWKTGLFVCLASPVYLLMFLVAATIFVGLSSAYTDDADREWMARAGAWTLIAIVVWAVVSGLVIFGPVGLLLAGLKLKALIISLGTGSGLVTLLGGRSEKTVAQQAAEKEKPKKAGLASIVMDYALMIAAPLFAAFILVLLALGVTLLVNALPFGPHAPLYAVPLAKNFHLAVLSESSCWLVLGVTLVILAVGVLMGLFINVNKFSLHAAYRDRLIRAYLGASRTASRRPNPFTGFDDKDNIQMHELLTDIYYPESFKAERVLALVTRLVKPSQKYEEHVWRNFPEPARAVLDKFQQQAATIDAARHALTDGFNHLLQHERLHACSAFAEFKQRPDIQAALAVQPEVPKLFLGIFSQQRTEQVTVEYVKLNRLFLDAAFAGEVESLAESMKRPRPLHVVNMALNLVGGKELAWQNRKAQSFTVTPLHAGSYCLGYRRATEYAVSPKQEGAITLGTAVAISGAAASPNMGYHSSSVVTFLLALFNVRLGWWLGNPGPAGETTYTKPSPTFAPRPLIAETLGWTDSEHPYVYLSDGGHFENLGIYEMVLRRVKYIVVSDAGCDPNFEFEDLGNALSKIRADLGVPIIFDEIPISRRPKKTPTYDANKEQDGYRKYCAVARICYSQVDGNAPTEDGTLIYLKPTFYGTEPADVYHYAKAHPDFPHETTGDQMYSESQFESYRMLGSYAVSRMVGGAAAPTSQAVMNQAVMNQAAVTRLVQLVCAYLGSQGRPALRPACEKSEAQRQLPQDASLPSADD